MTTEIRLLTIQELASVLRLSVSRLYSLIHEGKCPLPVVKVGRLVRFHPDDLERFLNERHKPRQPTDE